MTYLTISSQDTLEILATNVVSREQEVHSYQINIDNYQILLLALPQDECPEYLAQYINTPVAQLPSNISFEDVQTLADYQYRNLINSLLRTEMIEQSKAQRILNAIKSQIPAEQMDALVAAAKAKLALATAS